MKVKTFDMMTGEMIECDLVSVQEWSELARLRTPDGKEIVRKLARCDFDPEELQKFYKGE
jgi:hypothetical protein